MIDRIVIIDPKLRDKFGHHYAYSSALVGAAHAVGLSTIAFVNKQCHPQILAEVEGQPVFSDPPRPKFGNLEYGYAEEWIRINQACREQMAHIPQDAIRENDLIVIHSASPNDFFGLGIWYTGLKTPRPKIVIKFHQPPEYYVTNIEFGIARSLFARSAKIWKDLGGDNVIVASTNDKLTRHITLLSGLQTKTYPNFVLTSDLSATVRSSERPMFFSRAFRRKRESNKSWTSLCLPVQSWMICALLCTFPTQSNSEE